MYTNIPRKEVRDTIREILRRNNIREIEKNEILNVIDIL
jgi:hypothetical protein